MLNKKNMINFYQLFYPIQFNSLSLPTIFQLILINNGSLTQNLNSITGNEITIDLINEQIKDNHEIIRKVWLKSKLKKIAFAISCWQENRKNITTITPDQPIGQSMIINENDIYKDIKHITYGYSYHLEDILQIKEPLWNRKYEIWSNKKVVAIVEEFFSIRLSKTYHYKNIN